MKKILFYLPLSVLIACSIQNTRNSEQAKPKTSLTNSAGPNDPIEFGNFIDSFINAEIKKESIPGAAFVFVKDGKIFFMKGYGLANIEKNIPVDPQKTIFRIGSISKVFTIDAILQLADKNKINLTADVNNYLRNTKVPSTFPTPITPAHIATHTAGLDEIRPGTQSPDAAGVQTLNRFLSNKLVRLWSPGEIVMYSTYGITLGGLLVEDVSNQPFEKYLYENIFKPLQMQRTNITVPSALSSDVALGYEMQNGINVPEPWEWYHTIPASAINSTAENMAHWMIAHLNRGKFNSGRIMSEKMMDEMLAHQKGMHPSMHGMAYGFFRRIL